MSGWIKLHRTIFEHWIASDPEYLSVWLRMLSEANFEDKTKLFNGSLITIKRGQVVFGLQAWSDKTGVQISKLRRLISMLERDSMISRQVFNKYSLLSIVNYDLHQSDDRQDSRQTTGKQQADDRQTTTPKELKNIRSKEIEDLVDSGESPLAKNDFLLELFDKFWQHYKYKQGKQAAIKSFRKFMAKMPEGKCRFWMNLMLAYYMDCQEKGVLGYEKLHASTYINNKRWEDNPDFMAQFKQQWIEDHANGAS